MLDIDILFQPLRVGMTEVRNRLAMAPCTRQRAHIDGTPTDLMVEYYRQRAGAGLIITEGTAPSASGMGYLFMPGLYNDAHQDGWRKVADAVHREGGAIFVQVMHVGRLSDPLLQPGGSLPVAPSAVQPDSQSKQYSICPRPKRPYGTPHALSTDEVRAVIQQYADCARRARDAGMDGVEIHAASGYLPMQFLSTNTNQRDDAYGGSVANRARFLLECVDAMQKAAGEKFVAVKVSPGWNFHNVYDEDPVATYTYVVTELSKRGIAFLEVGNYNQPWDVHGTLRPLFDGPYMGVSGFGRASAIEAIKAGQMDMVALGQAFIANPDLVDRFRRGLPLNPPDPGTYYDQGNVGYTDYPTYDERRHDDLLPVDSDFRYRARTGDGRNREMA
jgi:N-ethylmaleimide reductase